MSTTVTMPQLGESVVEGTIGKWLVKEGDSVERDQAVVEVLTDKADSEVPSPVAGVVSKLLAGVDEVVRVGAGLCVIDEAAAGTQPPAPKAKASKPSDEIRPPAPAAQPVQAKAAAKAPEATPAATAGDSKASAPTCGVMCGAV